MQKNRIRIRVLRGIPVRKMLIFMKLFCIFQLVFLMSVQANVYSQQAIVNVKMENVSLNTIFTELGKQANCDFLYNNQMIRNKGLVSLNVENKSLEQLLKEWLPTLGLTYSYNDDVVVIRAAKDGPKKRMLTGIVRDEKKQPLPGVTVRLDSTTVGTATNEKGMFQLLLPVDQGTLILSFVGFKTERVKFNTKTDTLHITMKEDVSDLNEVVVRAYGSQKKREVVSAISTVTAEEMKELPSASITSMLQGRLAGVNIIQQSGAPGSAAVIAVRGFNSLLVNGASDGQPLWVVDGVPMHSFVSPVTGTNTLADLDPSMIESVQVLKDAAAASIYGSRAGNGVILVTTKKGKEGQAKFSANVSYSLSQLMEYPTQTGGRMERWLDILMNRNKKSIYGEMENGKWVIHYPTSYEDVYGTYGIYDMFWGDGSPSSARTYSNLQDSLDPYYNNSTNWWKYVFHNGKVVNANVQASGGSARFRYMVGLGYYDEKGIMINSGYSRVNLISNLSANFTSKLRMDTRIYLTYVDRTMNKSGNSSTSRYEGISANPLTQSTLVSASKELTEEWLMNTNSIKDRTDDYRAMVTSFIEHEFIKGLTLSASGSIDFSQANKNLFTPSTLDSWRHENKSEGTVNRQIMLSTEELLHYNKSIKDVHNIDILLGFNANKEQNFYIGGWGKKGASDDVFYYNPDGTKDAINYGTEKYPNWEATRYYKSDFTEKTMASFFGRLGYNYKQRYLLECTFRRDGSSTFGEEHRWANFPSVALGWTFSEEPFIKSWAGNWLNWGKIRGSYGTSGQIFSDPYLAHGLMAQSASFMGNPGYSTDKPVSPDLTWEKTEQYDLGLDMDMFNYRVNLKLDYYYKYTSSLIYEISLPGEFFTFSERVENAMAVSNEGLELELQADIFRESAITWRTKFNASRNWNRFEKSNSGKDINGTVIGRPLSGIYVYAHDGFYESEDEVPRYYTIDGTEDFYGGVPVSTKVSGQVGQYRLRDFDGNKQADMYYAGSALPLAHGGWVNEIQWKNFDLNMLVNYSIGRKMINAKIAYSFGNDPSKMLDYRDLKFWTHPGCDANMPAIGSPIRGELDSNIEKVNNMTLKQLTLGYNLPDQIAKKAGFSGVRLFVTAENLFYLSNYSGENPEVVNIYTGVDDGKAYPLSRKWTLGLTLNF